MFSGDDSSSRARVVYTNRSWILSILFICFWNWIDMDNYVFTYGWNSMQSLAGGVHLFTRGTCTKVTRLISCIIFFYFYKQAEMRWCLIDWIRCIVTLLFEIGWAEMHEMSLACEGRSIFPSLKMQNLWSFLHPQVQAKKATQATKQKKNRRFGMCGCSSA